MLPSKRLAIGPRGLIHALLVTLVVSGAALALLTRVAPLTGHATLVVAGPSMGRTLPMGSLLFLEPVTPAALAVGDIVSLRNGPARAIFTHRIVRLVQRGDGLWLETKGDANANVDPALLPAADVIGRVMLAIPYIGFVVAVAATPSGLLLIVVPGLLLLLASWILDPRRSPDRVAAAV